MIKGLLFALLACCAWGFIFPIPMFLKDFNPIEISFGRYFFLGLLSCVLLCFRWKQIKPHLYSKKIIISSLLMGLIGNIVYFMAVVGGLRFGHPALIALILGLSPIGIGLLGNWKSKEISVKKLVIPFILTGCGLICLNAASFKELLSNGSLLMYIVGLTSSFLALAIWCAFAYYNALFLKENQHVQPGDWATIIGVATFFWILIGIFLISPFITFEKYFSFEPQSIHYCLGTAVLGMLCSWLGTYLWNKASLYLPLSLAGQMLIFETLFGITFIYSLQKQLPTFLETTGMLAMLSATYIALQAFRKAPKEAF